MGKKAPKIPKPVDINYKKPIKNKKGKIIGYEPSIAEKKIKSTSEYYTEALPSTLALSEKYSPEFLKQGFDLGGQALTSFQSLQEKAAGGAAESMASLRAKELGLSTGQAGMVRGLFEAISPEQAAAVAQASRTATQAQGLESDFAGRAASMMEQYGSKVGTYDSSRAQQLAQEAFNRRGALSPEEQRAAQQQAREASAASGRIGGNLAIASEIQNREAAKAARREEASKLSQQAFTQTLAGGAQQAAERQIGFGQTMDIEQQRAKMREEAAQAGTRSFDMASQFYTQPGLDIFGKTPTSYTAGTTLAGTGLDLGKSMSPDLDYNLPLTLAREQAGGIDAQKLAQFEADQKAKAAQTKMIGDLVGKAASAAMMASDRRVKTNIRQVGRTDGGLPVFTYTYKGDNITHMGVMAQDVEKIHPEAVREFDGLKAVDYSLIK